MTFRENLIDPLVDTELRARAIPMDFDRVAGPGNLSIDCLFGFIPANAIDRKILLLSVFLGVGTRGSLLRIWLSKPFEVP